MSKEIDWAILGFRPVCHTKGHKWGECTCKTEVAQDDGFTHEGTWITDPSTSKCGRFFVDPEVYYGGVYKSWVANKILLEGV